MGMQKLGMHLEYITRPLSVKALMGKGYGCIRLWTTASDNLRGASYLISLTILYLGFLFKFAEFSREKVPFSHFHRKRPVGISVTVYYSCQFFGIGFIICWLLLVSCVELDLVRIVRLSHLRL